MMLDRIVAIAARHNSIVAIAYVIDALLILAIVYSLMTQSPATPIPCHDICLGA